MIAPEGYSTITFTVFAAVVLLAVSFSLPLVGQLVLIVLAIDVVTLTVFFFRDPKRSPPPDVDLDRVVVAPADGRVVEIAPETDLAEVGGNGTRISIFLSLVNVHVNRVPATGAIERIRYHPGDYLVAWHPKASEQNERAEFMLRHSSGATVLFRQIAGLLARRIVYHLEEGDEVRAGDRFGILKFGSRMDVVVPSHFELDIQEGDTVRAGESVLGLFAAGEPEASKTSDKWV